MPSRDPTVLVMAKAPLPGNAKTRLNPPLGLGLAARLAEAFLVDVLTAARAVDPGAALLCPTADAADLAARFPGVPIVVQTGAGLPAALAAAAVTGAALVAGDAPGIGPEPIDAALRSPADVALVPSHDGGYCLIRTARYDPAVFSGVSWSTASVLDQTVAAAEAAGLTVQLFDPVADVDVADDLRRIDLTRAPATARLLADPDVAPFVPLARPAVAGSTALHQSKWRTLRLDDLGADGAYAYLDVPRAVWVVPVTPSGETVLVRQYRHPVGAHPLEVPAGSVEPDEDPARAAARELREEVGGESGRLRRVGGFYSSSAHVSLQGLVYLAEGTRLGTPTHAAAEGIELVRLPFAHAADMARAGELCEAQSALALVLAWEAHARAPS